MYRNFEILRDFPYNNALFWIGTLPKNEQFAPENGWLEYDRFRPNFQGAFAVSCREGNIIWSNYSDLSRPGPPKDSWGREFPLFQGNLAWWHIISFGQIYWNPCFRNGISKDGRIFFMQERLYLVVFIPETTEQCKQRLAGLNVAWIWV